MYAVTRCAGIEIIAEVWHRFAAWRNGTHLRYGGRQLLEEHINMWDNSPYVLDLHLPIAE